MTGSIRERAEMIRVAKPMLLSAAAAVLLAGQSVSPAHAEEGAETHASQLVGVFYSTCVRHLQDDWQGLGQTMQQMGLDADPRPEVRKGMLGDSEGEVWSGQSDAGVVYLVFVPETKLCAMEFAETDADPAVLKQRFGEMSDQILQTVSGGEGAPEVERKRDAGQIDVEGGAGKMDYVSYLLLTDASSLGIYFELAVLPEAQAGRGRGHMSISYVPTKQGQQGQ